MRASAKMADAGTSFLLLHPCEGVPQVLPLLTAALRAHLDTGAPHLPPIPGAARPTLFHAPAAPRIDVEAYVQRLYRYTKCSPACLVMAYSYIQRLAAGDALLRPSPFNVHRMLIAGTMLAAKFMDDKYFTNKYYAQVGGVALEELNCLELELLRRLDYRAHVDVPEMCACLQQIEKAAAGGAAWVLLQAQPGAAPAAEAQLCSEGSADAPAPPLTPGSGDPLETATTGPLGCHQQQHKQQAAAAGYVSGGGRTYDRQQLRAAAHPCSMMPPEWPRTSCLGAVATTTGSTRSSGASPCTPTAGPADAPVRRHEGQQAQLVMACKVEHAEQVAPGGDGVVVHAA